MGGKVAQIVAAHKPDGLKGLVLVAPAPPTPLPVPREERERILRNLNSREGIESLLPRLANEPLKPKHHELVIENMLAGDPGAKRAWTDGGMDYDLTAQASKVNVPIRVVVGGNDAVETETALHTAFDRYYPGTDYVVIGGVGHLIPLQAPEQTAKAIREAANR
jgi:pimeloyl-ACP methyl ester carboxylesterase